MPLITKPNYNQIFASQAPTEDAPEFLNQEQGWGVSRANNGKPTIKQFNQLQQTSDLKTLWILQNGACLPYDASIEYQVGSLVLRNGVIHKVTSTGTEPLIGNTAAASVVDGNQSQDQINLFNGKKYDMPVGGYPVGAVVLLDNGKKVRSTVSNNTANPNSDLTGWINLNDSTLVELKLTEIANSIQKSLYDAVYDQMIDVTWFGANGNWNKDTQTGVNSTVAVQNAIAYLATLGTRRQGGKRGLKFPKGSFRVDSITLPTALGFGLDIIGDGVKTTNIYFDHTSVNPAITSEIEFVQFRNMSMIGSLNETWVTTRTPMYKGKLLDNRPDIDVTFFNCEIVYWNRASQIHGRGCVFESCTFGNVLYGMNIVVEDYTYGADTDLMQSKFATMRHYVYRNCRFDNTSRAYEVTGTGELIDYINDVLWVNNDVTAMDMLIEAPNAQFVNSYIGASTYLASFSGTAIKAKAFHMSSILGNVSTRSTNYASPPTSNTNCTEFFVDVSAPCSNLTINNNTVRGLRGAFYRNTSATPSRSVSICNNNLPEFGNWKGGNSAISFILSTANTLNMLVTGNNFSCTTVAGSYYLFNLNAAQQAKDIVVRDNTAPFIWADRIFSNTPTVYVNGVATTGTSTIKVHQYITDGDYVVGNFYYSGTVPENSGAVTISLPVLAIALASAFSSAPSGSAKIITATGISSAGFVFADALVNASTQRIEIRKQKDMTLSNIDAADVPAALSLCIEYKYRFK